MSSPGFKAMGVEDYLRTEEISPYKREYVGGFVYPLHGQAGVGTPHSLISGNIFGTLHGAARKVDCQRDRKQWNLTELGGYGKGSQYLTLSDSGWLGEGKAVIRSARRF